jgi:nicotinate phosphoribosyltransferase
LTPGKESYPGLKNVYRKYFRNGQIKSDTIGLEGEKKLGKPLLLPYIIKGKLIKKLPHIKVLRSYFSKELNKLPKKYLDIKQEYEFPVKISNSLKKLNNQVRQQHLK